MQVDALAWRRHGATLLFVLLWSGGALAAKWGLAHASAFAFLVIRLGVALAALTLVALTRRQWWPAAGTRWQVAGTGVLLVGGYQTAYLLSLAYGITPGALATVMGVQPILTLVALERAHGGRRLAGLALALGGLALVVAQSLLSAQLSITGSAWALAALACMTLGTLAQKGSRQTPLDVLPLQYAVGLAMALVVVPTQPWHVDASAGFWLALLYMGLVISVGATLLLYRMIAMGNLVTITSLFYLVPVVTALLDWGIFGHRPTALAVAGTAAILLGLRLALR
ncbi:DMT family transporter [Pandoraea nosoerga]|uniref:Multidrug DMT transporter permease n=1 Tax=Pandoraea nosoerga TaxID=2508296 RepID=A0A5E4S236_9BURK|nr:DMT family transporter [Pandoraea nosoerga]MBN4667699.1 DMT family transporter [Pandoraea nosoerga]MBN4676651.1 DMT family transporter [Pandoraea nosoerga]MBN4683099.1 DMT family transporter [Pandoraea nosoerga]MBN4743418.1 DMT family transporter [Pandoraea nosoerga]VVD68694.1 multidrug DMT transporter permease [Pandoraea nosoerga]